MVILINWIGAELKLCSDNITNYTYMYVYIYI